MKVKARDFDKKFDEGVDGTFCIHHKIALLHDDRDFDPMENFLKLKIVNA